MEAIDLGGIVHHVRDEGAGAPVLFVNSLGTDLRLWDALLPLLPAGLRRIRYDKRGHGLSDCPPGPYRMAELVADAAALLDALAVRGAVVVGLSIGGMIALGLAASRPDLVRGVVFSNSAARIGTPALWEERLALLAAGGMAAVAEAAMGRWFPAPFRAGPAVALWRNMVLRTPAEGYAGAAAAIAGADLRAAAATLRLPFLAVAGEADAALPPAVVAATAALVPGAREAVIAGAGHLPCVQMPEAYAAILNPFLTEVCGL